MSAQTQPQPHLDDKTMNAMLMEGVKEIEGLTTEKDTEVLELCNELEERDTSKYKVLYSLNSWELQLMSFFMRRSCESSSCLNFRCCTVMI
jgi:hypothetical protein